MRERITYVIDYIGIIIAARVAPVGNKMELY